MRSFGDWTRGVHACDVVDGDNETDFGAGAMGGAKALLQVPDSENARCTCLLLLFLLLFLPILLLLCFVVVLVVAAAVAADGAVVVVCAVVVYFHECL